MYKFQINKPTIEFFHKHNAFSALRAYIYIRNLHNNHFHSSDLHAMSDILLISQKAIRNNLRQLVKLGVAVNHSSGYWRINSWKTFTPRKRNRITHIKLSDLQDLKILRTFSYTVTSITRAYYTSRKNRRSELSKEKKFSDQGYYPTSASFIQSFHHSSITGGTILKHVRRSEDFGFINVKRSKTYMYQTTDRTDALHFLKDQVNDGVICFLYSSYQPVYVPPLGVLNSKVTAFGSTCSTSNLTQSRSSTRNLLDLHSSIDSTGFKTTYTVYRWNSNQIQI